MSCDNAFSTLRAAFSIRSFSVLLKAPRKRQLIMVSRVYMKMIGFTGPHRRCQFEDALPDGRRGEAWIAITQIDNPGRTPQLVHKLAGTAGILVRESDDGRSEEMATLPIGRLRKRPDSYAAGTENVRRQPIRVRWGRPRTTYDHGSGSWS